MKILYINSHSPDYISDGLFGGFYNLLGEDFTHLHDYELMYKSDKNTKDILLNSYGRGFTYYNNLTKNFNDNSDIESKIRNHYFNYIIYGSITRISDYIDLVLQNYKKSEICFVDGEDTSSISKHYNPYIIYFKRELKIDIEKFPFKNIYPISVSIPKEKITSEKLKKEKMMASIIPDKLETYIYYDEKDYYRDYQISYFGMTIKKFGWEALRHYEILMNYCLPYFPNIEYCPETCLTTLPKKQLIEARNIYENFSEDKYYELLDDVFEHTKIYLTNEYSAEYVLDKLIKINK
jgi:hypothetical protein